MKRFKQLLALLLALVMTVSVLTACGESKTEESDAPEAAVIATAVPFAKNGQYTTTVTSDTVELKDLTAENVEVLYIDADLYAQAIAEYEKTATVDEAKLADTMVAKAKVDSVKQNGSGWEIAFTDGKAADYATSFYQISFKSLEQYAGVEVTFPEMSLIPDLEFVTPADHAIKLTAELNGSEFEGEITPDDIVLSNAFSAMKVESVSAAGRNLTVQLTGNLTRNDVGAYQSGTVSVSPAVIKDGYAYVPAEVAVKLESAAFDPSTLTFADGKITGDFEIIGVADPASLTKDNVKLEGATVEAVEQTGDNTVRLTISADSVKSVNDFADQFGEKDIVLGDYSTLLGLEQASFYPVYDYVEADGDNLKLTLKLYAFDGSFSEELSADDFSFDEDFKDAKVESLTRESDTLATLILSIPANGMTEENMSLTGAVGLSAGAMTNAWGDKGTLDFEYSREYSPETLGKGLWDSIKNAFSSVGNAIKDGASYLWDKVSDGASSVWDRVKNGASNIWNTVKEIAPDLWDKIKNGGIDIWSGFKDGLGSIAEYLGLGNVKQDEIIAGQKALLDYSKETLAQLGAVRGDLASLRTDLASIKSSISSVLDNQYSIMDQLDQIAKALKILGNSGYRTNLRNLQTAIDLVSMTYELGAVYMALEDAVAEGKLAQMPDFSGYTRALLNKAIEPYRQYLPDVDKMTQKQAADYNDRIIDYIKARAKNDSDTEFNSFNDDYKDLKDALKSIASELAVTDSTNPMTRYDEICALTYNFDSQAFEFRAAQRLTAIALMEQAMTLIASCEKAMNKPMGATYTKHEALVEDAIILITLTPIGYAPDDIKASNGKKRPYSYVLKQNVGITGYEDTMLLCSGAIVQHSYNGKNWTIQGRDWTAVELNTFLNRAGGRTLQQEFASAGLTLNNPLAIELKVTSSWIEYGIRPEHVVEYKGRFMKPDATSAASAYAESESKMPTYSWKLRHPFSALIY